MVVGMELFQDHFSDYTAQYILIGGGACDQYFGTRGLEFRATKDLDIILVVEALTPEFVNHFWDFIKDGEYEIAQIGDNARFHRFSRPKATGYPKVLELFSRRPDSMNAPKDFHLTDIPTEEEQSSLSAILLDDEYYQFTIQNTILSDGLHHANEIALIVLKIKAYLNNRKRRNAGQEVREDDIDKHRKDVIRLTVTIDPAKRFEVSDAIKNDVLEYIEIVREENMDVRQLLKNLGTGGLTLNSILDQLETVFQLT